MEAPALELPFDSIDADVPWNPERHVELTPPESVTMLADWGPDAAGSTALSPVAITSPFRFLSDEGVSALHAICSELEQYAVGDDRIPKKRRGVVYRSAFLRGMVSDTTILAFLSDLAQVRLEPHPVTHHAVHINYAPDDLSLNVDQWHRDAVGFDFVLIASDPRPMKGGRFEYYAGSVEEGKDLLLSGTGLPAEKVRVPRAWLGRPAARTSSAASRVQARGALPAHHGRRLILGPCRAVEDPTDLPTLLRADGREVALVEWSRYQALVAARKLEHFAATKTDFEHSHEELQGDLRAVAALLAEAADVFDTAEEGRLISFGAG